MLKIGEIKKIANSREILLDFDDQLISDELINRWWELIELCGLHLESYTIEPSSSGTGLHAIIAVRERLSHMEAVAAQAILGSDPKREALNFRRKGLWNILFSKKYELGETKTKNKLTSFPQNMLK